MLSTTSHLRIQTEQARVEVVKWLRRRWVGVKQAGGFDKLEGWSLKELSHGEPVVRIYLDYSDGGGLPQKSMFLSMNSSIPRCQNTHHTNPW